MEMQLDKLYSDIAERILDMLPEDKWEEINLHAEILDDSSNVYFYFNTQADKEFQYSHDIPNIYGVSDEIYDELLTELNGKFEELRGIFIHNGQEKWTNVTVVLKYPSKFKINFGYEDILASKISPTQRQMIFEYQYLGIFPNGEENKKIIENFVKSQAE
ncbi:antitoxin YezG family protein [Paenibacillus sp. FSL R7-0204]|uniref:antitoxin YezG family protein n=1 Tax=Paenibacillus sp. FSL R7-0204 TaxID=2921675 RepID=UPI0030F7A991